MTTNNYFNYNTTLSDIHNIDLTGGMAFQKGRTLISQAEAEEFPSDAYQKLNAGASKTEASSGSTENTLLSYFLRGNYKLKDKYIVTLSGRIDGSSRFGANNRYAFFPAASIGWILSEEQFLSNLNWLNLFKIKASYGANGNDRIPDFAARGLFEPAPYGGQAGQVPSQLPNANLKWETTIGTDVGLEASLFKNRVSVEVDVYKRNTKDLLLSQEVPGTSGFTTQYSNIGNLTNKGIEVSIYTTNIASKNFRWTSSLNFSANKNKVTNLGGQSFRWG
ncbi:MAG: TonB-dependent receptor [Segetibacter sp.]